LFFLFAVLTLPEHFPGAELVLDGCSPSFIRLGNWQLSRSGFPDMLRWGFWLGKRLEAWREGIHLLGEWGFFDQPESRMSPYRWVASLFRSFIPRE
jgi:hypothetical protein